MTSLKRSRSGFSLIEQVVAIASVAVVNAVVVPAVVNQLDKSEISRIEGDLRSLEKATKDFRTDVSYWPGAILQLKDPLDPGDEDVYGESILSTVHAGWKGPYFEPKAFANIATSGDAQYRLASAAGTYFEDELLKADLIPAGSSQAASFTVVRLVNVDAEDAKKLSEAFDGEDKLCTGRLQWSTTGALNTGLCIEPTMGTKGTLIYYASSLN